MIAGAALRERIDAVRDIASYMARRLFTERLGVVSDFIATGRGDEIAAVFDGALPALAASRLRGRRDRGAPGGPEDGGRERAARDIRRGEPLCSAGSGSTRCSCAPCRCATRRRRTRWRTGSDCAGRYDDTRRAGALPSGGPVWLERASKWLMDMFRISVNAVTRERAGWMEQGYLEEATIVATRGRIQRYARDMTSTSP